MDNPEKKRRMDNQKTALGGQPQRYRPEAGGDAVANRTVSVVTPCYNGALFIPRFFDCILAQTHQDIELIFVDDGSDDRTFEKAESYRHALETRGMRFVCVRQNHAGQAAAINRGLAEVTGAFVTWPDSDDVMQPDNFEKKVRCLEEHPEAGFVCCQVARVNEKDIERVLSVDCVKDTSNPWLFDRLIRDKGAFCLDIAYMARSDALFSALGGRRIIENPMGQNLQLLLPLAYAFPCVFIDEPLASYVARQGSHSRSFTSPRSMLERNMLFEELLCSIVESIPMRSDDAAMYGEYARFRFIPQRFELAVLAEDVEIMRNAKRLLDETLGRNAVREAEAAACEIGIGPAVMRAIDALRRAKGALLRLLRRR